MQEMKLWEFANEYVLDEKLFIVPTRATGLLMINSMAREGKSGLNLNPITLKRLSLEVCERYIEENDILLIDDILGKSIVLDCLKSLEKEKEDFFFRENLIDEKTAQEVYRVIGELKSKKIVDFPKEKDLDKIYKLYTLKLKELNAMDHYDVLVKALEVEELTLFQQKQIGVAGNIEFHNLEREFFSALSRNAVKIKMPVQSLVDSPKEYFFKETGDRADIKKDICFFSSYGIRNEIKYIIEDILRKKIPLDEVVISYTDKKYVDAIDLEFRKENLGISFADGFDILTSTTYRFIKTIFDFSNNYYNIQEIRPMFYNGSLDIGKGFNKDKEITFDISSESMYEELVKSKVFYGRKNYEKLSAIPRDVDDEDKCRKEWLKEFFNEVMAALPEGDVGFKQYIEKLSYLIKKYVKVSNSYDKISMDTILETLKTIEKIPLIVKKEEYFSMVLSYIEEINVSRSGAAPGRVFACKYNNAGYAGRKHLYLIGLDSDSLASKTVESPILLDNIRRDISLSLSFSKESYRYKKYKIKEALTAPFTNISVGYSNFDMVDVKAKTPSKIYRELEEEYDHKDCFEPISKRLIAKDLVFSNADLETLGQCSRKLYFKRGLSLKEKEDIDVNIDRWLDPLTKGNLVHKVLNDFFDLRQNEQVEENLVRIIERESDEIEKEIPYILEEVYKREKEEIRDFCQNVIEREKTSDLTVFINELSFGRDKVNKIFGRLDAQIVNIGDLRLQIVGAIDRVDVNMDKKIFKIIDYKTGRLDNFNKRLRKTTGGKNNKVHDYSKGQKFQFLIYKLVLENIIKTQEEFKDFTVDSFSYEFKYDSIDLTFDKEFSDLIENRITSLLEIDILENNKRIVYDEDDVLTCKYCEFKNICKTDKMKIEEEEEGA